MKDRAIFATRREEALDAIPYSPIDYWARREEAWLYFHLHAARRARQAMDTMAWDDEYAEQYGARKRAVAEAERHYRLLRYAGVTVDPMLEQMLTAERTAP
jgi:hypothetical protein